MRIRASIIGVFALLIGFDAGHGEAIIGLAGQSQFIYHVENGGDCTRMRAEMNSRVSQLYAQRSNCMKTKPRGRPEYPTVCGVVSQTLWPQCSSLQNQICSMENERTRMTAECYDIVRRKQAAALEEARELAEKRLRADQKRFRQENSGSVFDMLGETNLSRLDLSPSQFERSELAAQALNLMRPGAGTTNRLSQVLTAYGLSKLYQTSGGALSDLNTALKAYNAGPSSGNPIPTTGALSASWEPKFSDMSRFVPENTALSLYLGMYASERGLQEIGPQLANLAATRGLPLDGSVPPGQLVERWGAGWEGERQERRATRQPNESQMRFEMTQLLRRVEAHEQSVAVSHVPKSQNNNGTGQRVSGTMTPAERCSKKYGGSKGRQVQISISVKCRYPFLAIGYYPDGGGYSQCMKNNSHLNSVQEHQYNLCISGFIE